MDKDHLKSGFHHIHLLLKKATVLLSEAAEEINTHDSNNKSTSIKEIGKALGSIYLAQIQIPDFNPISESNTHYYKWDGSLTKEQQNLVDKLSKDELAAIDDALLSQCDIKFRKVARVVGTMMSTFSYHKDGIPDIFYAQRVIKLVISGRLEVQGIIGSMGQSEVRLPHNS